MVLLYSVSIKLLLNPSIICNAFFGEYSRRFRTKVLTMSRSLCAGIPQISAKERILYSCMSRCSITTFENRCRVVATLSWKLGQKTLPSGIFVSRKEKEDDQRPFLYDVCFATGYG